MTVFSCGPPLPTPSWVAHHRCCHENLQVLSYNFWSKSIMCSFRVKVCQLAICGLISFRVVLKIFQSYFPLFLIVIFLSSSHLHCLLVIPTTWMAYTTYGIYLSTACGPPPRLVWHNTIFGTSHEILSMHYFALILIP